MGLKYIQDMSYLIIAGLRHILSSHLIVFLLICVFVQVSLLNTS